MKKHLVLICLLFLFSGPAYGLSDTRTALVIGNSKYKTSPLANPANDASDISKNLEECGFQVIKCIDADQRTMEMAIDEFYNKLKKAKIGLFYYAGHGIQFKSDNYLIPVDANIKSESDIKFEAVNAGRILGKMTDAGNDLNIIILDACRDNPFKRAFRSTNQGLMKMEAPRGSILVYSTAPGSLAADGAGRNGLFTSYFLKNMMTPDITIEKVLKITRKSVYHQTKGDQVPWASSSLMGDFFFIESPQTLKVKPQSVASLGPTKLEKQRPELEREKPKTEKLRIASKPPSPVGDKRFINVSKGIIWDKQTNMEWIAGPDSPTTWSDARSWVQNLSVDNGGWRMPTTEELGTLYAKGLGKRNMTPLLKTTGWFVWTGLGSSGTYQDFQFGRGEASKRNETLDIGSRSFAVRKRM